MIEINYTDINEKQFVFSSKIILKNRFNDFMKEAWRKEYFAVAVLEIEDTRKCFIFKQLQKVLS